MEKDRKDKIVQKGKRGIFHLVFGRTGIFAAIIIFQIIVLFATFQWLASYINVGYLYVVYQVCMVLLVIHIINREEDPAFKLSWIIPVLTLPVFGLLFYLFIKMQTGNRLMGRKIEWVEASTRHYALPSSRTLEDARRLYPESQGVAVYLDQVAGYPPYENTEVTYFSLGEEQFQEIQRQLKEAKDFIFLEYFIISPGYMWDRILEILEGKAREGVDVRLIYDGTNSFNSLPTKYPKEMEKKGVKCKVFAPVIPLLSTKQNNRDHRKIIVIDGKVAFTGGINMADEYINRKERFGHWKDTGIMLKGEAVRSFTLMFIRMWAIDAKPEDYSHFLEVDSCELAKNAEGMVIPYGDSPLNGETVGRNVYLQLLYSAKHYVHIMTPYLIVDQDIITALTFAAKRGVDVKIIMPYKPDKWIINAIAKTYYHQLISNGVEIYEYLPGFVHAKSFVVDDREAVVGTINLDYRSLYLHFECAAYMSKVPCIVDMEKDFQETLSKCQKITLELLGKKYMFHMLVGQVFRLFAPLL